MKLSFKPTHLKRYKDIAYLLLKYGRSDLAKKLNVEGMRDKSDLEKIKPGDPQPEELADDLEKMGPTFVKLGQLLSGRVDLLPPEYLKGLERLQDKVKPFPFEDVEKAIVSELGVRISKGFNSFDEKSVAAASLGQVHSATLRDGRQVVVKVQRPQIREQITEDFEVLEEIATFFEEHTDVGKRYQFIKILDEFKLSLLQELDYQREASNLVTLGENLKVFPHIFVPQPVPSYCSRSVLTMDYVSGTKITNLSPMVQLEIDGNMLAEELFQAYLQQVLVDGFFHADPHPGNIFLTEDKRIALLDLGMIGRVTPGMQEHLLRLLIAVSEGNGEEAGKIVLRISDTTEEFDETNFKKHVNNLVAEQNNKTLVQQDVGMALLQMGRIAAEDGLRAPSELTILGKTLMQLDDVGKILSPTFNPNASVRRNVAKIMTHRMWKSASPGKVFGSMLEMKDFIGGLPERVNKLLDAASNAELQVNVRTPDAHHLLNGFEKIANRITTGVILASLIIGAALLMQVNSSGGFQIFGYPGLAMLCFLAGIGGAGWLVVVILIKDYKDKRKRHDEL